LSGPERPLTRSPISRRAAERLAAHFAPWARPGRRLQRQMDHLAHHDALTGLHNRRGFEVELRRQVLESERSERGAALIVIDLDNFKYVNDTLGHAAGDELLCRVAAALREALRRDDALARLGGDEFGVVVPGVDRGAAREVADKLLEAIRRDGAVVGSGRVTHTTASIGVAPIDPAAACSAEQLMIDAELAMYAAKEAGRARVSVCEAGDSASSELDESLAWADRIRRALKHDGFVLYEQPIVHLATGEVARHEILLRMVGEGGEHIAPNEFLPVAERFGLVQEIDAWVVRNSIALIAQQQRQGRRLQLEVNLSGASVTDPHLLGTIEHELTITGIDPALLTFEITETAAIVNITRAQTFAQRLAELGCRFALDDFGAGFGGFFYLKHLPFDTLKIDGEFVRGLLGSPRDQVMVKAIAQIAADLSTHSVAEFVADQQTCELLHSYGIGFAQGFGIAQPQPITQTWPPPPLRSAYSAA
jgi:diguanylate cyclase (GGDEF)-like protein